MRVMKRRQVLFGIITITAGYESIVVGLDWFVTKVKLLGIPIYIHMERVK